MHKEYFYSHYGMFAAESCTKIRVLGHIISTKFPVSDFAAAQVVAMQTAPYLEGQQWKPP
jgi:hypothetical protein